LKKKDVKRGIKPAAQHRSGSLQAATSGELKRLSDKADFGKSWCHCEEQSDEAISSFVVQSIYERQNRLLLRQRRIAMT